MNIVVIGLGSMGKRRIRLLHELYPSYTIFGVDSREDRRNEVLETLKIQCFESIDTIIARIDCAFICSSPLTHASLISECLKKKWHVFTELNLVSDGYEENMILAEENNCKLFLSSTFFYRDEIKYIRSKITKEKKWNYIYHIGQYLPDWHPWEAYRDFFIGDKRTNGCREVMAIELPWLIATFGDVREMHVVSNKMTDLNIDYSDNFLIQFQHETGNKGIVVVDVVSPYAVRKLEVYTEGAYLAWGGTPESLLEYDTDNQVLMPIVFHEETEHRNGYSSFIVENAYKNEIREFFEVVLENKEPLYGFKQDKLILSMIDSLGA